MVGEFPRVTVPPRLAGICKKCHEFRYGYLMYGRGPFICYQCAELAGKTTPGTTDTTYNPRTRYFSYTFTTSNSTGSPMYPDAKYFKIDGA